jgi:hypothetical protein
MTSGDRGSILAERAWKFYLLGIAIFVLTLGILQDAANTVPRLFEIAGGAIAAGTAINIGLSFRRESKSLRNS